MDLDEARDVAEQCADWLAAELATGAGGEGGGKLQDFHDAIRAVVLALDAHKDASTPAFDEIAKLCGCATWEYPGQVIRDVELVVKQRDELLGEIDRARAAAHVYAERVDALGLAADDNDPLVMETAEPIGAAQADLWAALGILDRNADGEVFAKPPAETIEQLRAERDTARALADARGKEVARLAQVAADLTASIEAKL